MLTLLLVVFYCCLWLCELTCQCRSTDGFFRCLPYDFLFLIFIFQNNLDNFHLLYLFQFYITFFLQLSDHAKVWTAKSEQKKWQIIQNWQSMDSLTVLPCTSLTGTYQICSWKPHRLRGRMPDEKRSCAFRCPEVGKRPFYFVGWSPLPPTKTYKKNNKSRSSNNDQITGKKQRNETENYYEEQRKCLDQTAGQ